MDLGDRVFRILLRAYPAGFRQRYRDDLVAFFHAERRNPRYATPIVGRLMFWTVTLFDLIRAASTERFATVMSQRVPTTPRPHPYSASRLEPMRQDLSYAIRTLSRSPGFSLVALATLTLGIGSTAAMFSLVNGVLFDELPYRDVDRVVTLFGTDTDGRFGISDNERLRFREQTDIFESFGTYRFAQVRVTDDDGAARMVAAVLDDRVLPALGVTVARGRPLQPDDTQPGGDEVALLSHQLWTSRFGGDEGIVGQTIRINDRPRTVVGIVPPRFRLPGDFIGSPVQVYLAQIIGDPDPRNLHYMSGVARLRDGVTMDGAQQQLDVLGIRLKEELPTLPTAFSPAIQPVEDLVLGEVRPALLILLGSVTLVLLIACVNVANLYLARADARATEMGVRVALGASRGRLVRQIMTEGVVLAAMGGGLGLLLASGVNQLVVRFNPPNVPRIDALGIDLRVVLFTVGISVAAALLFGLVPALVSSGRDVREALHGGRRTTGSAGRLRLRRTLVVAEVALAVVLATGAGLLVRSFVEMQRVDPGFTAQRVLTFQLALPGTTYGTANDARGYYRDLLTQLRGIPGVEAAGATTALPLASNPGDWGIRIEGREEERLLSGRRPWADRIIVTDDYFETLGMRVVEGRTLTSSDIASGQPVVLINETAARRYWPDESPIGKRFLLSANIDSVYRTIIGITEDVRHGGLTADPRPEMYLPHAQPPTQTFPVGAMTVVVRSTTDPSAIADRARQVVMARDPGVPISDLQTMEDVLASSTSTARMNLALFAAFGLLGLMLVSVGVYGVMSYFITQRTHELGIRMALGAAPRSMLTLVVGNGMGLTLTGGVVGVVGALLLGRFLSGLLYGVQSNDPVTLGVVTFTVVGVALAATAIPARRAMTVDPMRVLRSE